jgi:hypothetical protein
MICFIKSIDDKKSSILPTYFVFFRYFVVKIQAGLVVKVGRIQFKETGVNPWQRELVAI